MSNLVSRVLTSIVLLPIVIAAFVIGGVILKLLLGLICLLCAYEVAAIIHPSNMRARVLAGLATLGFYVPMVMELHASVAILSLFAVFALFNGVVLFTSTIDAREFEKLSAIFYWTLYVTFAVLCLFWTMVTPHGFDARTGLSFVFVACLATWGNDTFAYFGGRMFGKHPLFPSVSAKKTWEGFVSGAICSALLIVGIAYGGMLVDVDVFTGLRLADFIWVMVPAMILAPVGDLIESRLKRIYDTKDSSKILPGHGGLLDRVDGLLLTLPWTALYAFIIRPMW